MDTTDTNLSDVDPSLVHFDDTLDPNMADVTDMKAEYIEHSVNMLALLDRCDRCGAQAWAQVTMKANGEGKSSTLLFCGHHLGRNLEALKDSPHVARIDDYRQALAKTGMTSANAL